MKKENKKNTISIIILFVFMFGFFMGGSISSFLVAASLKDVDIAFENAIQIQKENNQLINEISVFKYRLNDSFNCNIKNIIQEEKIKEYKLILKNMHLNYNNQDERFEKMLESYLAARMEAQDSDYRYSLCYEGIYPHRKEFNQ